jgi:broad specificity phosphatase PhoE
MLNVKFFITRHGTTAGNLENAYRGWSNSPEARLNGAGRDVIREAALFLRGTGSFPLIISDDLDRSVESREILKSILQIPFDLTEPKLRPLNVGDFTGKSKKDNPLDEYIKDKSKVIPGGESLNQFNLRQAAVFETIFDIIEKVGKPIVIVGHGSTVSFLHNHFNEGAEIGYEGLTNPGGVSMFTSKGIEPLTHKREGAPSSLAQGTNVAGYVRASENRPPRECWNCEWYVRDVNDLGGCLNPVVRIDPQLAAQRQSDGTVAVGEQDCCNYFVNKIGS